MDVSLKIIPIKIPIGVMNENKMIKSEPTSFNRGPSFLIWTPSAKASTHLWLKIAKPKEMKEL